MISPFAAQKIDKQDESPHHLLAFKSWKMNHSLEKTPNGIKKTSWPGHLKIGNAYYQFFDYSPKWTLFAEDACEKLP